MRNFGFDLWFSACVSDAIYSLSYVPDMPDTLLRF